MLPTGETVAPQIAFKVSGQLDFGDIYAALLDVYYSYDPNQTRLARDSADDSKEDGKEKVDFSDAYMRSEQFMLVRADEEMAIMAAARAAPTQPVASGWWRNLALWRGASAAGALATVLAVVTAVGLRDNLGSQIGELQARLANTPKVEYVAVLNDDQASAAMLVTFDPTTQRLTLQRVGGFQEASDKSLQLWALPPAGSPRSLGVLSQERLLQLAAGEADVREVPNLAISLEPKGGVPSETGPTGPVLFKGALIQKML